MGRASINSRTIQADRKTVYEAFSDKKALAYWLAPHGMTGIIHNFNFKVGGKYEMSLYYNDNQTEGKTSGNEDRFFATFKEIVPHEKIVQTIHFDSDNDEFKGEMTMEIQIKAIDNKTTEVIIIFNNIPTGINPKDNEVGTAQSLQKLADFIGRGKPKRDVNTSNAS